MLTTSKSTKWDTKNFQLPGFERAEMLNRVLMMLYRPATESAATKYLQTQQQSAFVGTELRF